MKKLIKPFLAIAGVLSFSACIKNTQGTGIVCEPPVAPYAAFKVVDKATGDDLFFAATPKYQLKDFYAFKATDKARHDTIKPQVYSAGANKVLLLPLDYSKTKDILIIKIANTPDDVFAYTVIHNISPCGASALDKAYLNNAAITTTDGRYIISK